jgi:hypothetical protein
MKALLVQNMWKRSDYPRHVVKLIEKWVINDGEYF